MYNGFLSSEIKKSFRDPLMKFMVFYPVLFGLVGRYIIPRIAATSGFNVDLYADLIIVVLTLLTPHVYGALVGFSILDDRDDNVLTAIRVTPLSIHQFLSFRLAVGFLLSFVACSWVIWFSRIGTFSLINIVLISFLISLATPFEGLLINALSKNKIEGFAVMKGIGTIVIFPIVALFFLDTKELIFAFAPGFWPAKAISALIRGEELLLLTYSQYYLIGLAYIVLLNVGIYKVFLDRAKI